MMGVGVKEGKRALLSKGMSGGGYIVTSGVLYGFSHTSTVPGLAHCVASLKHLLNLLV